MTKSFEKFLKQYYAVGREKGEGYDSSHFEGMTHNELETAEKMLIKDATQLDTTAIRGLGVLKSKNAEITLRSLLEKVSAPSYAHLHIAKALWEITNDLVFQEIIFEDFDEDNDPLRQQVAIALEGTKPSKFTFKIFVEMLRKEKESTMRTSAASGILIFYGLLESPIDYKNFQKYLPLVRILTHSTDEKSLSIAINEVEKEAAKLTR
jgi:hypothetical protein